MSAPANWLDRQDDLRYLSAFRNEARFCEALAVEIRDDAAKALDLPPEKVRVILEQKARGGITITATS